MTTPGDDGSDFYEEDEPVEKIRQAFDRGKKVITRRPRDLNQRAASIVAAATSDTPWLLKVPTDAGNVIITRVHLERGYVEVGTPSVTVR